MSGCIAVGGTCGMPCVHDWTYCRKHLQADQVADELERLRREVRWLRADVCNSSLRADDLRTAVFNRLDAMLSVSPEPPECRCSNPIEPSAMCPMHGIKPGDTFGWAPGEKERLEKRHKKGGK